MRNSSLVVVFFVACVTLLLGASTSAQADPARRIHPNAESARPQAVGTKVPSAALRSLDGDPIDLAKLVSESGALLVFYRGGW